MNRDVESPTESSSSSSMHSSLLQRVREHDHDAWQRMVHIYSPLIYDWCRIQRLQPADSADVLQDVFRSVAGNLENFRRDRPRDSFRGWLWTITRNKILDHFRKQNNRGNALGGTNAAQRMHEVPDEEPSTSTGGSSGEATNNPYRRAVDLLRMEFEDRTWQAFYQVTIDGRATADVAADLGISVNAVRKAKSRVLRRLRDEFGDLLS